MKILLGSNRPWRSLKVESHDGSEYKTLAMPEPVSGFGEKRVLILTTKSSPVTPAIFYHFHRLFLSSLRDLNRLRRQKFAPYVLHRLHHRRRSRNELTTDYHLPPNRQRTFIHPHPFTPLYSLLNSLTLNHLHR